MTKPFKPFALLILALGRMAYLTGLLVAFPKRLNGMAVALWQTAFDFGFKKAQTFSTGLNGRA
jgi:hypothetical protein